MKTLQLLLLVFLSFIITANNTLFANEAANKPRVYVLNTFTKAIELNEDFKRSIDKYPTEEQQKKRKKIEQYQENELANALKDCVKLLSSGNDMLLANQFFKLVISFDNTSDEALSYAFGEIFFNNPDIIINAFTKFNKTEKKFLLKQLRWGFENITYEKEIPESLLRDRRAKLKKIQSSIDRRN